VAISQGNMPTFVLVPKLQLGNASAPQRLQPQASDSVLRWLAMKPELQWGNYVPKLELGNEGGGGR
jgi:hypothetical protein